MGDNYGYKGGLRYRGRGWGRKLPPRRTPVFKASTERTPLVYGLRGSELIHIRQIAKAQNGKLCDCVCPDKACGKPLIAYTLGRQKRPYFGHAPDHADPAIAGECRGNGPESALHKRAKEAVSRLMRLNLPAATIYLDGPEISRMTVLEACSIDLDAGSVVLEQWAHPVRPDITATVRSQPFFIEIVVSNGCSPGKREYLTSKNLTAVEVVLSDLDRNATDTEVERAVLEQGRVRWIHHPAYPAAQAGLKAKLKAEREERIMLDHIRELANKALWEARDALGKEDGDAWYNEQVLPLLHNGFDREEALRRMSIMRQKVDHLASEAYWSEVANEVRDAALADARATYGSEQAAQSFVEAHVNPICDRIRRGKHGSLTLFRRSASC